MNYGRHSSCSGSSCFADSRGLRRIHHKTTTVSCFFRHPFVNFFQASIPSGHGAGQAFEAFFFLHPHLTVWWLQAGAGAAWVAPGTVARSSRGWAWEGQGRTRGCRGCPGTHSNCPGVQIPSRCPRAPPAIPCWGLRFREFALIHIYNIFFYVTSPPRQLFSP